jgi:hypothetical protein
MYKTMCLFDKSKLPLDLCKHDVIKDKDSNKCLNNFKQDIEVRDKNICDLG